MIFEPIKTAVIHWKNGLPHFSESDDIDFYEESLLDKSHVLIESHQLLTRWQALPCSSPGTFVIAETSFGMGLNFLLTWSLWEQHAPPSARLHFISCEQHPLARHDLAQCLRLWPALNKWTQSLLAVYPILTPGWHVLHLSNRVTLTLMLGEVLQCYRELLVCGDALLENQLRTWHIDAWFLDGFALNKDPESWPDKLFPMMRQLSKPQTTVVAVSNENQVKKGLQTAGFQLSIPSSFNTTRKIVCALLPEYPSPLSTQRRDCHTPWAMAKSHVNSDHHAIIIGAGLAGCFTAEALVRRGWRVSLIDDRSNIAYGASGNHHAVLYPKFSTYRSPLTEFMLNAFLFAVRRYQTILTKTSCGELEGIFQLPYRPQEQKIHASLVPWLKHYPELGCLVDAPTASQLLGIALQTGGLWIPQAGWIDAQVLCQYLVECNGVEWIPQTSVSQLDYEDGQWSVAGHRAPTVIIANGYQVNQFTQTSHLPMKTMHGQMTMVSSTPQSACLKIPLCGDAHILPMRDGRHSIGATYNPALMTEDCFERDDKLNLDNLRALPTDPIWSLKPLDHWAGIRGATPDYLPLVGPVAKAEDFLHSFATLATNSKRWIPTVCQHYPGLFVCAGFGSRGLTSIPLSAEYLASVIHQEPHGLSRTLVQALSPARFLYRTLTRG